jgi:CheY-like chemotaxis protein
MAKRILIADDEPNIVISLEFLLRREGYEVVVATNGAEALASVREQRPDLAILDVMMPQRNGFEVCQGTRDGSRQGPGAGRRPLHDQAVFHPRTGRPGQGPAGRRLMPRDAKLFHATLRDR